MTLGDIKASWGIYSLLPSGQPIGLSQTLDLAIFWLLDYGKKHGVLDVTMQVVKLTNTTLTVCGCQLWCSLELM